MTKAIQVEQDIVYVIALIYKGMLHQRKVTLSGSSNWRDALVAVVETLAREKTDHYSYRVLDEQQKELLKVLALLPISEGETIKLLPYIKLPHDPELKWIVRIV